MHDNTDPGADGQHPWSLPRLTQAIAQAGATAGHNAAAWWEQDTLGGRATGDTTARAATMLRGLDNTDPAILDALPTPPTDLTDLYHDTIPDAVAWSALDQADRDALDSAFRDAFDAALQSEVIRHCLNQNTDIPRGAV